MYSKYAILGGHKPKVVLAGILFEDGVAELEAPATVAQHNILTNFHGVLPVDLVEKGEDGNFYPQGEVPKPKTEGKPEPKEETATATEPKAGKK